ncbi:Nonribosomal peptide synthetase [Lachnellula occidentalis]|uniref:Nonribosomal peptide synthetase n=1 Tax=Lachnellula occidentalis TaxID=215460 RepID=A0A8H8RZT2_9HELO|nr:Nonribosomal peptide synthetase [Lachnellula occidentalis]
MASGTISTNREDSSISYLNGAIPCRFPPSEHLACDETHFTSMHIQLAHADCLRALFAKDPEAVRTTICLVWALLLHKYVGQDDVSFACRNITSAENTVDVAAMRILIEENILLGDLISRFRQLGHLGSQCVSSVSLMHLCNTAVIFDNSVGSVCKNKTSNPLLLSQELKQVGHIAPLSYQNFADEHCTQFSLGLEVTTTSDEQKIVLHHDSKRISTEQALNIASTVDKLLSEMLTRPDASVADLNYVSDCNIKDITAWNTRPVEVVDRCIHEVIHDKAIRQPNAEAVCDEHRTLSYRDLDQISSRLASHLVTLGVGPGMFIPLCFEKEAWNVVCMIAVLKAGAAFVPFNPAAPIAHLRALSLDVAATVILCSQQHAGMLLPLAEHIMPVDGEMIGHLPKTNGADCLAQSSDLAYVIFTSGTTGQPKGTMIEHRSFCSGAKAHAPAMLINSKSRVLQFAVCTPSVFVPHSILIADSQAHTFDASLVEILTTLMVGGVVCIPSEDQRLNNITLAINQMGVNWAVLTPSFVGFINPVDVPGLKTLTLAGEAMSQTHISTWSHINLVNGYGPSECSVAAAVNSHVTPSTSPTDIGNATGARLWVVEQFDYNCLVPVGCVGELLVQGPTLARGYHGQPDKTAESFISTTTWAPLFDVDKQNWRFYRTGDLVRQSSNGTFMFVGRKDTQVKVHGQRVELGEVEHHINVDPDVKHALALLPKSGYFKNRLVAVLSLNNSNKVSGNDIFTLVDGNWPEIMRHRLLSRLPSHMVPSMWLIVESVPTLPSGKLDRKITATWVQTMNETSYRRIVDISQPSGNTTETSKGPTTEMENKLRQIWSHVLNLELDHVGLESAFLSLGGDSISAMQVKGQCVKKDISLGVQEILRSKGIKQLAQCAKAVEHQMHHEEVLNENFDLSPIQKLFFELPNQGHGHFNQSFFLRVTRKIQEEDLRTAVEIIVKRHSMLRARFNNTNKGWQQWITPDIATSYRLKSHRIGVRAEATTAISDSQTCLDPASGPLFAVDLFDVDGSEQLLFMVGHHLVIDLVSWRIILEDLEELLVNQSSSPTQEQLPFQTWCQLQAEDCQKLAVDKVLPIRDVPSADTEYWGMTHHANTYGQVKCEGFEVDATTTSKLSTLCHETLRTETIDLLLSSLLYSFSLIFPDRPAPAIYNEGHGRETISGIEADLSRTVGWFTIMYPVYVSSTVSKDLVNTVKEVKDLRRRIPGNGRPYFASRCLTDEGKSNFGTSSTHEITFNYLGQYQQLERKGGLLTPVEDMAGEAKGAGGTADVGHDTPRFGLFEISAVIVQGKLRFSFTFNRNMRHQGKISKWITACQSSINVLAETLAKMEPQATPGDFPLLSLTTESFTSMINSSLPPLGVSDIDDVEDIYPCSSMQEGLLISQTKSSAFYAVHVICELQVRNGIQANSKRLEQAWLKVVGRHPLLRTVFIESVSKDDGLYDQVVLKQVLPNVIIEHYTHEDEALSVLAKKRTSKYDNSRPAHRFTICNTSEGKIFCKLEISHTIMDGTSMSVLLRDLAAAYENILPQRPGPLYSDYISYLQNQPSDIGIEYWKSYLSDLDVCNFPLLNDGQVVERDLKTVRLDFKQSQFLELQKFCDANGVTFSNVLHTAWGLTLRSFTSSEDTCFGYLTSGRDAPVNGIEDAVGPFINLLVCRVRTAPASRLGAVLDQVQKDYFDSLPYRSTSLAEIQHALRLSGTALFNTALSYRRLPSESKAALNNVSFLECLPTYDPTEYSISLNIEASEADAAIDLDYWTDYISEGQAVNVGSTFMQCLWNIVHHSTETIESLDHFSTENREQVYKWNATMPQTVDDCVHRVIEQQAQMQPGAPAVCGFDVELNYAELNDISGRLAFLLSGMGIRPETMVPTCFDKSSYAIVSMLSVLKAGAAAVPLDCTHPRSALELRVRDTGAKVVLASPSRAELFSDMDVHVIPVCKELLDKLPSPGDWKCSAVGPNNPAFVIFTSGSTGKPKGVVLENRALCSSGLATGSAYGWGPGTRVLQFASYTFDNSLAEIFVALMRGGCVCVPSEHDRFNNLAEAVNKLGVNFMDITPTVANLLHPSDVPNVKSLSLGGEPLTKDNIEVWGNAVALHCCYGPSECSINSTWNGDLGRSTEATNIGKSIGSVSWIVGPSNHDRLVPIGCVGELLIEGPILARGYLNDPDKTSKAFIHNPTWASGGTRRFYKTGDLCRYNSDGSITYLGRKDTQVKLNGQRLELGEIEHHVKRNLKSDTQSAVELIPVSAATKALAVFICLSSGEKASPDEFLLAMSDEVRSISTALEAAISAALPAYMVPSVYIPVSSMPMTSSGKLDRRKLRTICQSLSGDQITSYKLARRTGRQPSTEMEKLLARLWESVLNLDYSVGADDNFFKCTGDSITAMRLITAARSERVCLGIADIFRKPRLSDLAADATLLSRFDDITLQSAVTPFSLLQSNKSIPELLVDLAFQCRVETSSIQDIYPCTSLQQGLIALSSKDPGAYVAQNIYRLPPGINLDRFRAAWEKVVEAEVILRTRIVYTESLGFLQVVTSEPIIWHETANLSDLVEQDRQLPSYNGGLLSRYTIVESPGNTPHFVWTAHHAIYDGWCISLLLERVEACYHDIRAVDMAIGAGYSRFIKFLLEINASESDDFWRSRLSEPTSIHFPTLPNPTYQVHATSSSSHSASLMRNTGSHITLPSVIRASWALVVAIYSGSPDDVVFGEILTGRDAPVPDLANIIGPTLATVPTRVRINAESNIGKFLEDIQAQSAEAIPYQYSGLQHIKHLSDDAAIACGFQNILAINHDSKEPADGFWDLQSSGTTGTNFYSYPLTVSCQVGEETIAVDAYYDKDVISSWLVEQMLRQFEFVLGVLNGPENQHLNLGEVKILEPEDEQAILNWNSERPRVVDECIHDIISRQVLQQPKWSLAVDAHDAKFSYWELDRLSTQLAHYLLDQKLENTFIPLCFDKSAFAVCSMVAVLKCGAAFVPLDPAAPVARLRNIIKDTEAKTILCSPRLLGLCGLVASNAIAVDLEMMKQLPKHEGSLPAVDSNSVAYVIYTSGSTGKPKGTIVQHNAFCAGAAEHGPALGMSSSSRVLQFASYQLKTFDASLLEILTSLTIGACICVPDEDSRMNRITDVINEMNITWTLLTPSFIQTIQPSAVPTLKTLVLGGEAMSQTHLSTWVDKLELINAYGPSECAVVATANPQMTLSTDPNNMGRAVAGRSWITDRSNPNRLVPIGSVGELIIEGPILAQGYLNNKSKTEEVFIQNPEWALAQNHPANTTTRRFYRTGDLVKYAADGSLLFCGRHDYQAKIRGQRVELGEVEVYLRTDPAIQHALVTIPKAGFCKKRLVAVLSLQELATTNITAHGLNVVIREASAFYLNAIRERLRDYLPGFMIPSNWVIVESLPLSPSGKLDRNRIEKWVEQMSSEVYYQIVDVESAVTKTTGTAVERRLQAIWGAALNLPPDNISLQQNFLSVGGDSISAMQVMSSCRAEGLGVRVQDIIQSKSISQLALKVTLPEAESSHEEEFDADFDLSPIQKLYFECVGDKFNHFNQSVVLRLTRDITSESLALAVESLMLSHSMLRARFNKIATGEWKQQISRNILNSYDYTVTTTTRDQLDSLIETRQKGLDIQNGPIFAVDLFDISDEGSQIISLVSHHLAIDVVSWRIILQDLEDVLNTGALKLQSSIPFQTWARLQTEHSQQSISKRLFHPEDVPAADFSYWDMVDKPNVYGDTIEDGLEIDAETTRLLLGACHESLQTEPIDVFLGAVLQNRIPDKGRPYFAYRQLTEEGRERFSSHCPEVTFNYLGKMQQLERKDSLFHVVEGVKNLDIGEDVPRFALFEISVVVENSKLKVSFHYNRRMKRQAKIRRWVVECQRSLEDAAKILAQSKVQSTLSNFPLIPLTYNGISKLAEKLPQLGVSSLNDIEDVYPCSPTQQGMLLAQLKDPNLYAYSAIFEAKRNDLETQVDVRLLAEAWQAVVRRHATLRTVFTDSVCQDGLNDQVVLKDKIARVSWLECEDSQVLSILQKQRLLNFQDFQPPHRFTLCKTDSNRVLCKLEISHSICDGASMPILLRDLSDAYGDAHSRAVAGFLSTNNDTAQNKSTYNVIGPLYSNYIAHIQSSLPDDDINYWKIYLSDVEPCLLTSLNDGVHETKGLRSLVLSLSKAVELRMFCNENGLTLSNVLQLTWAILLQLYSGSDEVCFGYLTSGRDAPIRGIQDAAVGAFINMLTCRSTLSSSTKMSQALEQIQTDFIHGIAHQSCSLAEVQHELGLSGNNLFNTAFTFQKRSSSEHISSSALSFDMMDAQDPSEYDVTVNVEASDSGVEIHFGYWTTTLSAPQASNLAQTFEHIVNTIIENKPESTIGDLNFFGDRSREQVLTWNHTLPPKVNRCIHDIVQQQTRAYPKSKQAVCSWDAEFSYVELDELATRLATKLIELGVGPELFVPLCFEKTAWAVVSMLAVMKAGGAFVPLDHTHPEGRLQQFIDDVDAKVVLCSRQNYEKISAVSKLAVVVDRGSMHQLDKTPTVHPIVSPDNVAYAIFTSGTTGRPKGTLIEHGAFCTSAVEHSKAMYMRSDSRVFQFASYTFDASVMEILTSLIVGACICIPSDEDRMNDISGAVKRMGVTWTLLTPSVASTLTSKSVPSLKTLVTGGEAMAAGHIAKWKGKVALVNAYGPSETSVIASTSTKVDEHGNEINGDSSNIGHAAGGRTWVVDPRDYNKLVPIGCIGELVVEGRTVARGYLNNEQKTAEVFVNDPAWLRHLQPRERAYRTGDLVRYNSNGSLSFVARKDTQVKLNGQRIELGEIEHHVKTMLPEAYQSAVELVAPMSNRSTKALAAFFSSAINNSTSDVEDERVSGFDDILLSTSEGARDIAKNLDSSLASVLPTYMIPSFYIPVTKMPLTSSGKLDRSRLRNIIQSLPKEVTNAYRLANSETHTSRVPTSPIGQKLQKLWETVLSISSQGSVGLEDHFFRLGGDSVSAMRLVGLSRAEGILLSVMDIFRSPRLCDMASICSAVQEEHTSDLIPFSLLKDGESIDGVVHELVENCRVPKEQIQDAYPCSLLQEGLITLSMKQQGAYVAQNVFLLPNDLDLDRFKQAWQATLEEVDILRTRVVHMNSSSFLQVVLRAEPIEWKTSTNLQQISDSPSQLPLYNGGPLTEYTIVTDTKSNECHFVWSIHHALYDGWSLPMVLKRVETAYVDSGSSLPKSSYALFIKYLSEVDEPASDEFWRKRLSGSSPLQFPQNQHVSTDRRTNNQTFTHSVQISQNTSSMGITLPSIIRAAWSMVLAAYSGSNDVVFGETLAGRDIPIHGIAEIIGPTFTTVPNRIQVHRHCKVIQFLEDIQKIAAEVIPYQHAGLQRIKRLDRDAELACDFQNLLVIQTAEEDVQNDMWDIQGTGVASNFFTYPLVLECKGSAKKVDITAHYDENVLSAWEIRRLMNQLDNVLEQLSDLHKFGANAILDEINVFSAEDKELVREWNSAEPELVDACIHEEFEEMAFSQPQSVAISAWDGQFTYAELKNLSTRLAYHLVGQGVGPEVFVPICMDKSKWAVVTIVAILMAGGAYVPLDPSAPTSRHQEMIKDVNATIVICSPNYSSRYTSIIEKSITISQEMLDTLPGNPLHGHDLLHRATSRNSCYAIFTSGSTGRPKGTVVEHRAIATSSAAMRRTLLMKPSSRVFQFASFTFDVSVLETLTALTNGSCICIPSEEQRVGDVAGAIDSLKATWAFLTPSVASLIEPATVPALVSFMVHNVPPQLRHSGLLKALVSFLIP